MSERQRAVDLAHRALGQRERTVFELRAYLERKRVDPEAIDGTVEELRAAGLLDDARFAKRFAHDKRTLERWGSERIERDLHRRGVPDDLIEAATSARDPLDELSAAVTLLAEKVATPLSDDRARDRAWRLLVRKGYGAELAYDAVRAHSDRAA